MFLQRRLPLRAVVALSVVGLAVLPNTASGEPRTGRAATYSITDLGTLGGTFSAPIDLNDRGQVVGVSAQRGDAALRGFVWERGVMRDMGSLGGPQAGAVSVNSSGQVGGWSNLDAPAAPSIFNTESIFCNPPMVEGEPAAICHATLRDHGRLIDLGTLGGENSAAWNMGINDRGQVVGAAETDELDPTGIAAAHRFHAFQWQPDPTHRARGRMVDLGTLGADPDSFAKAINNRGQVIGISIADIAEFRGFNGTGVTWQHGRIKRLSTIGGRYAKPVAINDLGHIVGVSEIASEDGLHATLWKNGRATDLGTFPATDTAKPPTSTTRA